jgi:hypothetical protein
MQQIIEQLASDAGIGLDEAKCFFTAISGLIVARVPSLKIIIDDVATQAEDCVLKEHINRLIILLQEQQSRELFGNWIIPQRNETTHRAEYNELF